MKSLKNKRNVYIPWTFNSDKNKDSKYLYIEIWFKRIYQTNSYAYTTPTGEYLTFTVWFFLKFSSISTRCRCCSSELVSLRARESNDFVVSVRVLHRTYRQVYVKQMRPRTWYRFRIREMCTFHEHSIQIRT